MDWKKHKYLFVNLICILVFIVVAFVSFDVWLKSWTSHGETIEVPDLSSLEVSDAQLVAEKDGLLVKVNDTLSVEGFAPGVVVDHFPKKGAKVKTGRTIYLSVNSMSPVMVVMPKVTDVSLRQATQLLENRGLKLGTIDYKPDFADNYVFEQRIASRQIEPGSKVPKGTAIDLLVGKGGAGVEISVPDLVGMSWRAISDSLVARGLVVNPIYKSDVRTAEDSIEARVQSQSPVGGSRMMASGVIDVWLGTGTEEIIID